MDPLVRGALVARRLGALVAGALLSILLAGYLVWSTAVGAPAPWDAAALAVLAGSTLLRAARRLLRQPAERELGRRDFELFANLLVGAYAAVLHSPGGLDGSFYPVIYALAMLAASFARPSAACAALGFAILLESALHYVALGRHDSERLLAHSGLLGVFALLNMLVFRAEIARIRRLSRLRIDTELEKVRDTARTYRLLGAPSSAVDYGKTPPPDGEERLVQSGVDEIHQAVEFALGLLERTLGLRSALLLGLDAAGNTLSLLELRSSEDGILPGPFSAREGIFGASLTRREQLSLAGEHANVRLPYYAERPAVAAVCATPLVDHGQPRGLLVVDRGEGSAFSADEQAVLARAAHFVERAIENERVFAQLDRAKVEQGKLYRAADALASATTEAKVIEAGVSGAREFAAFDFAVVTLFDRNGNEHEICAVSGEGAAELLGQRFRHNSGLVSMVVANRHALPYRGDYDAARQIVFTRRLAPPAMPSLLVLPLLVHERALGTLVLGSRHKGVFRDAVRQALEVLASHVAVSLANARMLKRLEELATLDGLTGLFNKRALTEIGQQKLRSATRFKKPLSLLVCDLDHFKHVNDTHGHDVGDLVIRGFADVLRRVKRDTDAVGRFGGEEFVVVCEETDEAGATQLGERIRVELENTTFHTERGPLQVTCSVGIAPFPTGGASWEALFKATDEALYASKRNGRNRATVWSPRLQGGCAA